MKSFKQYLQEKSKLDTLYSKVPSAKAEIDSIGQNIANKVGGFYIDGGIKNKTRSAEKVEKEYNGDASKLKDVVRGTIAVDKDNIDQTKSLLKPISTELKHHKGNSSPLGYSGVNSHIKTDNGLKGEIQVNTPEMIYAKEKPEIARKMLGDELYNKISKQLGAAGKGSEYYQKWRSADDNSREKQDIQKSCKKYYSSIRKKLK